MILTGKGRSQSVRIHGCSNWEVTQTPAPLGLFGRDILKAAKLGDLGGLLLKPSSVTGTGRKAKDFPQGLY